VGKPFRVRIRLNDIGRVVPKGHRLRLAIQNQFWFVLWPQPDLSLMRIESGASVLRLPVRPPSPLDRQVRFAPPEIAAPAAVDTIREGASAKTVEDDLATGLRTIRMTTDFGAWHLPDRGISGSSLSRDVFVIHPDEPLTASLHSRYEWTMTSGPAAAAGIAETWLTADRENFHLVWRIEVREGGSIVHADQRETIIPRDFC
jgi:hypothetical protein